MYRLLGRKNSINVQKVLWLLEDLEIDFERIDVGGEFGYPDNYRSMSPENTVPVLDAGKYAVRESNTILRYLADEHGDTARYPIDSVARAEIEAWMDWQLSNVSALFPSVYVPLIREKRDPSGEPLFEMAVAKLASAFNTVAEHLKHRDYLAGGRLTLADIAVGSYASRWLRLPIEHTGCESLHAWHARLERSPGFQRHVNVPLA